MPNMTEEVPVDGGVLRLVWSGSDGGAMDPYAGAYHLQARIGDRVEDFWLTEPWSGFSGEGRAEILRVVLGRLS